MSKALEESSLCGTIPTSSASPPESKKREKTAPHYLRASTGSCHDLCKYGHRNPSEEELRFPGRRRKKHPTQLSNLALHRSTILDRSKDVRNTSLSLAKSSISLGEAERVAPKLTSAVRKGVASKEQLVPRTASSAEPKTLSSDGRKRYSMAAEKAPTNPRYSSGVTTKCDKKEAMAGKGAIYSAKLKVQEKALLEKSRTVDKVTTVKQSTLKRPTSSPTDRNMTKQVPVASQGSICHLRSLKDKSTPKGKVTSPSATINRVRAKPRLSPTKSSNANTDGKEGSDMSRSSFSMESKLSASVGIEGDLHLTGTSIGSMPEQLCSDATECIGNSRPAPEESSKPISNDDELGSTEKGEALAGEASLESDTALELQQSLDDKEFNGVPCESDPGHGLAENNVMDDRALKDEDSQTDNASPCQFSEKLISVETEDIYDPVLTPSHSKIEDDDINVNVCAEPLNSDGKEQVGAHEDILRSPEILSIDEKHVEEAEFCLDFASGKAAENDKADEVRDSRMDPCASQCQMISETSSDSELLEDPKSMLIEPSDCIIQIESLANVGNENIGSEGLKSSIIIQQSPEELSDDAFYEEYDFEFSESDESGTEDEESSANKNRDGSLKAGGQRTRRMTALELDDSNATPYKLKFKRGKILELPPDSSGPRRLKFRRKVANEVSISQSQLARRIYKRSNTDNVVPANPDVKSSGVKLRHQDAQDKKDAQGLFNNVIEETASKLVESRKSKVKALVGAFETVISLQDGKPTSSTQQAGNSEDSVHDDEGNAHEEVQ